MVDAKRWLTGTPDPATEPVLTASEVSQNDSLFFCGTLHV